MNTKPIIAGEQAASCYFRTSVEKPHRKALIQIDERCNLHCVHCFVSATGRGSSMPLGAVDDILVPRLSECRVKRMTLKA
jgi:MoaA/NifB/PqqE/SkfB family radical SAM enzyme